MKNSATAMAKLPKNKRSKEDLLVTLSRKRHKALERVVAIWEKGGHSIEDDEALASALDVLTITHLAATFDWASGPHKW